MVKIEPLEYRVVVLPDPIEEKVGNGIIVKAEQTKANDRRMQTKGTVMAVSKCSFEQWKGTPPKVDDRVLFAMYAGQFYTEDEVEYKIMNDDDIIGILKE